jgi:hypothetical protein
VHQRDLTLEMAELQGKRGVGWVLLPRKQEGQEPAQMGRMTAHYILAAPSGAPEGMLPSSGRFFNNFSKAA